MTHQFNLSGIRKRYRYPLLVGIISAVIIAVNVIGLLHGITIVLPHLFYIPIILAAYRYQKKGVYFSAFLGFVYLSSEMILTGFDLENSIAALARFAVFLSIALVVAFFSSKLRMEEEKYRDVVEDQTELIARFLPDGAYTFVNNAFSSYFGKTREELIGHRYYPEIHPEDRRKLAEHFASLTADHPVDTLRHRIVMPDGEVRWQRWVDHALFDNEHNLIEYQSVGRDVTDIIAAEEAVRESERLKSDIIDFLPDPTFAIDAKGHVIAWNNAIEVMTGVPAGEMMGMGNYEYAIPFYGERRPILIDYMLTMDKKSAEANYTLLTCDRNLLIAETDLAHPLGKDMVLWGKASLLYDQKGNVIGAIETIRDITERKRTNEALQDLTQFQQKVIDNSDVWVVVSDIHGQVLIWNKAAERITGYSRDFVLGNNKIWQLLTPDVMVQQTITRLIRGITEKTGVINELPFPILTKEGEERFLLISLRSLTDEDGTPYATVGMGIDITERKHAEEQLRFTQFTVDYAQDPIFWVRPDSTIFYVNEKACAELGYSREELVTMNVHDIDPSFPIERREGFWNELKTRKSFTFESIQRKKDGTIIPIEISANFLKFKDHEYEVTSTRDISEKKAAEERERSAFKQIEENLSQLAILNDSIRNPLTVIVAIADIMGGDDAEKILSQAREIDDIITQLDMGWLESVKIRKFLHTHYEIE